MDKKERARLSSLLLWFSWRILPQSVYANNLWTLKDIATFINREVGISGAVAVTDQHVLSMVRLNKVDDKGDDFIIPHKEGCTNPHRRVKDVEPFRGTKRPIGTNGRDTMVFGWSSCNALQLPVGDASILSGQKLKIGDMEDDEEKLKEIKSLLGYVDVVNDENGSPNGGESASMAAAATSGSFGTTSDAGGTGTGTGTGDGRTPPPPSRKRTRQSALCSPKLSRHFRMPSRMAYSMACPISRLSLVPSLLVGYM